MIIFSIFYTNIHTFAKVQNLDNFATCDSGQKVFHTSSSLKARCS